MAYTAYVLDQQSRDKLKQKFPPKYDKFIGHHITVQFGVNKNTQPPEPATIKVVGYINNDDGLEALVVTVDGKVRRSDDSMYHITWSLDPDRYSPKDSNDLLKSKQYSIVLPIEIEAEPKTLT